MSVGVIAKSTRTMCSDECRADAARKKAQKEGRLRICSVCNKEFIGKYEFDDFCGKRCEKAGREGGKFLVV